MEDWFVVFDAEVPDDGGEDDGYASPDPRGKVILETISAELLSMGYAIGPTFPRDDYGWEADIKLKGWFQGLTLLLQAFDGAWLINAYATGLLRGSKSEAVLQRWSSHIEEVMDTLPILQLKASGSREELNDEGYNL